MRQARHARHLVSGVIVSALAALSACKPSPGDGSGVRTLDNMARGGGEKLVKHQCAGDDAVSSSELEALTKAHLVEAPGPVSLQEVQRVLSAVPSSLREFYFKHGNRIVLDKDAAKTCEALKAQSQDAFFVDLSQKSGGVVYASCASIRFFHDDAQRAPVAASQLKEELKNGKIAEVTTGVVDARYPDAISLLMAMFVTEKLSGFDKDKGTISAESKTFADAKKALADEVKAAYAGKPDAFASYRDLSEKDFASMLFAQAADSLLCNADTRASLARVAPKSKAYLETLLSDASIGALTHKQSYGLGRVDWYEDVVDYYHPESGAYLGSDSYAVQHYYDDDGRYQGSWDSYQAYDHTTGQGYADSVAYGPGGDYSYVWEAGPVDSGGTPGYVNQ